MKADSKIPNNILNTKSMAKLLTSPVITVQRLHMIPAMITIHFLLNLSERYPPKIAKCANEMENPAPASSP